MSDGLIEAAEPVIRELRIVADRIIALNNDQREDGHEPDPDSAQAEYHVRRAISSLAKSGRL